MQAGCCERLIVQEFKACTQHLQRGILAQPSVTNIFQWQVTLMPPSGVFKDRVLTFWLHFDNFPAAVPRIHFQEGIIHPLIDPAKNVFRTSDKFPEWSVAVRVYALINYVFDSFVEIPAVRSPPDQEAAQLARQGVDAFAQRAIKALPPPPEPAEQSEFNRPRRWSPQHERLAHILVAIGAH
jgi:ubiquitin-protein ligase